MGAVRPNYRALVAILLLALLGRWTASRADRMPPADRPPATTAVPLTFAGWVGAASDLTAVEREMLNPEAAIVRQYRAYVGDQVQDIGLLVIYGHAKSNLHSPANCFLGTGWAITRKSVTSLPTGEGAGAPRLHMTRLLLVKGDSRSVVLYSFLSPGRSTASWIGFQARLLSDRLLGRRPPGALLRLVVPVTATEQAADEAAARFVRDVHPFLRQAFPL